jgi:hypothetical protein
MRKTSAFILAGLGLILAVGLPVAVATFFNIDLGGKPGLLVGGMMPGLGVMIAARKLWKGAPVARATPDVIPPGHHVCELCGKL